MTHLWGLMKTALRGKFIAVKFLYQQIREISNNLMMHLEAF